MLLAGAGRPHFRLVWLTARASGAASISRPRSARTACSPHRGSPRSAWRPGLRGRSASRPAAPALATATAPGAATAVSQVDDRDRGTRSTARSATLRVGRPGLRRGTLGGHRRQLRVQPPERSVQVASHIRQARPRLDVASQARLRCRPGRMRWRPTRPWGHRGRSRYWKLIHSRNRGRPHAQRHSSSGHCHLLGVWWSWIISPST